MPDYPCRPSDVKPRGKRSAPDTRSALVRSHLYNGILGLLGEQKGISARDRALWNISGIIEVQCPELRPELKLLKPIANKRPLLNHAPSTAIDYPFSSTISP